MKKLDISSKRKKKYAKVYRRCVLYDDVEAWLCGSPTRLATMTGVSKLLLNKAKRAGYFQTRMSLLIYDLSAGSVRMREVHEVAAYLILKNEHDIIVNPDNAVKTFNQVENGRKITSPYQTQGLRTQTS